MKKCINCGAEGDDRTNFCGRGGSKMEFVKNPLFCPNCGNRFWDDSKFCACCGQKRDWAVNSIGSTAERYEGYIRKNIVEDLSRRVKINGIIWICVGTIQIILGLGNIGLAVYVSSLWVNAIVLCVIGGLNLFSAYLDLKYSKKILRDPRGIVKEYSPLTSAIITLIWNCAVAIWGVIGVVGVAGSIYYLVGVRGFVMNNKEEFMMYETDA